MPLPIDLDKDVAVGISLPLRSGKGGYFNQTYTTLEQVTSNVINLLLTIPGERYMQPRFGSKLHQYLFEPYDELVKEDIIDSISEALAEWLPYVIVEDISVRDPLSDEEIKSAGSFSSTEELTHLIYVTLSLSLSADPETHLEITFRGDSSTGQVAVDATTPFGETSSDVSNKTTKQIYDSVRRVDLPSL